MDTAIATCQDAGLRFEMVVEQPREDWTYRVLKLRSPGGMEVLLEEQVPRDLPPAADVNVEVKPVLDRLALWYHLEPDPRAAAVRIADAILARAQFVLGHPDVTPVLIPVGEAGRGGSNVYPRAAAQNLASRSGSAQSITSWKSATMASGGGSACHRQHAPYQ